MDQQIVSEPMDFNYKEGNAVDFTKTFDLTGNDNDQMLKLYLRKAGLSDNIEYLTSEQRRAFIYDIIKSNKNPGYWKPSVLPQTPTPSRSPFQKPAVERESSISLDSIDDIPPASMTFDLDKYRQNKNANSNLNRKQNNLPVEQMQNTRTTLYERQFSQKQHISNKVSNPQPKQTVSNKVRNQQPQPSSSPIPLPTTTLVTRKGRRLEVSGPQNFRHISGDMTRDMTKNAFDLSGNFNSNSLKKYMIERGITEEDPPSRHHVVHTVPPPPSKTYIAATPRSPSPPRNINLSKGGAIIVEPPKPPQTLAPLGDDNIYEEIIPPKRNTTSIRRQRRKPLPPPPPPPVSSDVNKVSESVNSQQITNGNDLPSKVPVNKSKSFSAVPPPPPHPPPPTTVSTNKPSVGVPSPPPPPPPPMPIEQSAKFEACAPPPPPPPPTALMPINVSKESSPQQPLTNPGSVDGPKKQQFSPQPKVSAGPPPPPAPPVNIIKPSAQFKPAETGGEPDRNAFLESIRTGVTLKKVTNQEKKITNNTGTPSAMKQPPQQQKIPSDTIKQAPVHSEKPDFMSELRNATLKRIKKLEHNPYASESEC
ncbi:uncharacterized protein LOC129914858 isoform X2 [Episyrphus balteatus]|uniref:uncharacterized protein LOC129914858 isoform X2 n=1 Tax=Episyrphus balteatus TaxID=286459 RepID=UPI002485783C|nr:uncharacterized protein LOC129914858 isoform X2 [Episyrphus balteatus]